MNTRIRPARLVQLAPPLAQDHQTMVCLTGFSTGIKEGDWGVLQLRGNAWFLEGPVQATQRCFPGSEWDRLQKPDDQGRTRLEALRFRHRVLRRVREFFDTREYLEVETPVRVVSPGVETHLQAMQVPGIFPLRLNSK